MRRSVDAYNNIHAVETMEILGESHNEKKITLSFDVTFMYLCIIFK